MGFSTQIWAEGLFYSGIHYFFQDVRPIYRYAQRTGDGNKKYSKGLNSRRAGLNKNGGLKFALFLKYVFKNRKWIQDFWEKYAIFQARRFYLDQPDDYWAFSSSINAKNVEAGR